jgi:hypothetical protein
MRETYNNVENLSNARPFDLMFVTAFPYRQILQLLGQELSKTWKERVRRDF